MPEQTNPLANTVELRRRAEAHLKAQTAPSLSPQTEADSKRLLHELQVHQIELELQNSELQEARDRAETLLETYTDLYDFAPVGYLSIDEQGLILEVNLTGAALLGVERSRLINHGFQGFIDLPSRMTFLVFLKTVLSDRAKHICELPLRNERGTHFWADLQAASVDSIRGGRKWCRMAISDLTALKHEQEVQRRLEDMANANRDLKREIVQREKAELALKQSETQLRHLSRQLLLTQEEERKRISRELHDEIVQTLVGINVHLASLTTKEPVNLKDLRKRIGRTQQLVEKSVTIVHRFARELRPTVLDDLGLIPALRSFIKDFTRRTSLHIDFKAFSGVEKLDGTQRTVLYRVAQSALTNVDKHAHATEVKVSIRKFQGTICLEIHDNGKSFDMKRVLFAKRHKRLGLLGSRERVEMVGGKFSVTSTPDHGTTIRAEIPINEDEPELSPKTPRKKTPSV
jgi:PAS domain S-box-containing protein